LVGHAALRPRELLFYPDWLVSVKSASGFINHVIKADAVFKTKTGKIYVQIKSSLPPVNEIKFLNKRNIVLVVVSPFDDFPEIRKNTLEAIERFRRSQIS
jgi:hypothetical protein